MREIRYRAWDEERQKMYEVRELRLWGTENAHIFVKGRGWINAGKGTVMQYTGLKDKNGKEIYEGDIITQHGVLTWEVRYNSKQCAFKYYSVGKYNISGDILKSVVEIEDEIIGNKWENGELMR